MKKLLILLLIAFAFTVESCGSSCGANKWRKRRYVEVEKPSQPIVHQTTNFKQVS